MWEKKRVLLTIKAYPERSRKHGQVVCCGGLTDEGEWIRLYPMHLHLFSGKSKLKKYDWIELECRKAKEKLGRKESYNVREGSIRIVNRDLHEKKVKGRVDWAERNKIILPHVVPSLEYLKEKFKEDRTSMGLVKPTALEKFYKKEPLKIFPRGTSIQEAIFGPSTPVIEDIPHIFGYRFKCDGCRDDGSHEIQCEDWELFESYRSWGPRYGNVKVLWEKLHQRYFLEMLEKNDLYFYMGTFSQFPTWIIIGLYYPPAQVDN